MISGPPSLRRRLLAFLALPMLGLLTFNTILAYYVALDYSNRIHDRNLIDDTHSFAQMLSAMPVTSDLSPQARFLIEYDPDGHRYFNVDSSRMGTLSGNADFSPYAPSQDCTGVHPALYDGTLNGQQVRMATVCTQAMNDPQDQLAVTVAESMADRRQRAREILMIIIPLMTMLALGTAALVWFGVTYGLRILTPLRTRLAQRRGELAPISDADVPEEIQPLISTIDDLFARQAEMITLQNRFIADAAHQLRSPLAGMALHVDQALAHGDPDTVREALQHIRRLNQRTARVSTQLLALSRAQTVPDTVEALDLCELVPRWVGMRVPEAIRDGIDLGYRGSPHPLRVLGNGAMLQEALDNLIDNALRYAGRAATVTVGVQALDDNDVELYVEDNGPGVPEDVMPRLGERFFRAPGTTSSGTGLGLAIAHEAVEHFGGRLGFLNRAGGGLKVTITLPLLKAP
ncbi:sensor histidine kinase [Stenotrophomonas maltophilia]|uniref:sensor histidine kinase n=1 Tax=Stenotrophomonas TaxID=40323 RepID=UPI00130FB34F|nr:MULTISPECIES: sensor histidine kinase [Stenotrophomonas]ELC7321797.1 sensor histidine kinase [Stenotrophomonas maltophilia]MBA0278320.1 sensor histidine kinase [Stenotrophomonas maltophilia]MBA0411891.1 sensor histidine kinase [Stenotrophomonas maltophilia]MBA0497565.1 sensor histidine kinase [Stenotrophomonas maltophilia]MBA0502109.1 sensor histidine kinase [Stenotrophomonas maltophilia]